MPTGPKGEKRLRDPNQLAKLIVDIATGQVEDRELTPEEQAKKRGASRRDSEGAASSVHREKMTIDREND
jgi:hypothetical protein